MEFEPLFPWISRRAKVGYAKYDLSTGEGVAMGQWYLNMGEVPGTPLNQMVGIYSNVKLEDRECLKASLSRLIHGETDRDQRETRVKDGEGWKWIRLDVIEAGLKKSSPILLPMSYDISKLKAMEERMLKAEKSECLKPFFLANISHEVCMPLNAIVGLSSLLGDEENGELRQECINPTQANNELLSGTVNDVSDLAKLGSGAITSDFTESDLGQLVVETIASFQIKVPRGVALTYPESLSFFLLHSDYIRLKQVFGNSMTNAIKYTSIGSIILSY